MRNFKIVIFICVFALVLVGCGKSPLFNKVGKVDNPIAGQVLVEVGYSIKWIVPPDLIELSSAEISLKEPLTSTQKLYVYLWMDMGHGSSPIEIKQLNATDFIISELSFFMPGEWFLKFEILENNQVITKWQKSYTLTR